MIKKHNNTKLITKMSLITAFFVVLIIFAGCSSQPPAISPMPLIDESKSASKQSENAVIIKETDIATAPVVVDAYSVGTIKPQGSNIENGGYTLQTDSLLYYTKDGLYSMTPQGYHKTLILDQKDILYLNQHGDDLFYVSSNDYFVYRYNRSQDDTPIKLNIEGAYALMIIGDYIYYQNAIGVNADYYLYRTNLDGSNPENLTIKSANFCSDGQFIYFANAEDDNKLYVFDAFSGEIEQLSNNQARQLNIDGDDLYYINKTTDHITKINVKSLESIILSDEHSTYLNMNDDLLIFSSNEKGMLGTMQKDGSQIQYILEYNDINGLNIIGDWVFFESYRNTFDEKIFCIKTDGTQLSETLPVTSLSRIVDYDAENKLILCDAVRYLTGESALDAYINDHSVSKRKAEKALAEHQGVYIQNKSKKIEAYKVSDFTYIALTIISDGTRAEDLYNANLFDFEDMLNKDANLITSGLYTITTFENEIISIIEEILP